MGDTEAPGGTLPTVDLSRVAKLIRSLERDPERVQTYYGELEAAIRWLMDATFEATDPNEKAIGAGQPASDRRISHPLRIFSSGAA